VGLKRLIREENLESDMLTSQPAIITIYDLHLLGGAKKNCQYKHHFVTHNCHGIIQGYEPHILDMVAQEM